MTAFVDVILPLPLHRAFTYELLPGMEARVRPGCLVRVPFGASKHYTGMVWQTHTDRPQGYEVKTVSALLCEGAVMALPLQRSLWKWMAGYYLCAEGEVMKAALSGVLEGRMPAEATERRVFPAPGLDDPAALDMALAALKRAPGQQTLLRQLARWAGAGGVERDRLLGDAGVGLGALQALVKRGLATMEDCPVEPPPPDNRPIRLKELTAPQQRALCETERAWWEKDVCLLHGVTSAGKTEIYMHLAAKCMERGGQTLYMLPEIALTTQIINRLQQAFGDVVGVYHSRLTPTERVAMWHRQLSDNPYQVVLGVRSAVLLPWQRLGLVVVDEEHDPSYKQQDPAPRYHARNTALVLARMAGAKALLATATPSLESWHHATATGKYALVRLTERYQHMELPLVLTANTAEMRRKRLMKGCLTPLLKEEMERALGDGRQVILFHNRRGFAPVLECGACGWIPRCTRCDVSLTLHKKTNRLMCHYCGGSFDVPAVCPQCGSRSLRDWGLGTEKVEDEIKALFPQAVVGRMDFDTTRGRAACERIIGSFEQGHTHILIGTQMVTKGLDFDNVQLVGILNADQMLGQPDFRAHERAYQLMAQVAGRAGRKSSRGRVVIQTGNPEHPVVRQLVEGCYDSMAAMQLEERGLFRFPPFYRLAYITLKHRNEAALNAAAAVASDWLRGRMGARVSGPMKPPVSRVQSLHIRMFMLRMEESMPLQLLQETLRQMKEYLLAQHGMGALSVHGDMDPV